VIQEVDGDQPIHQVKTMEQWLAESIASQRLVMLLTTLFGGLALILAAIGIYGVMAYTVAQRTHEIGIRMALGARPSDVLRAVMTEGMKLAIIGTAGGLLLAFALTRLLGSLLYEVSTTDTQTFIIAPVVLLFIGLLACFIPARRATKVDPLVALRYE
jgi:putative ABC transport system permease protein